VSVSNLYERPSYEAHIEISRRLTMSAIGDKFKECRLEKGLSVREVAEKAGVCDTEVFRIETGKRVKPSASILVSIGKALGMANDDVLLLAGLKENNDVPMIEKVFPDLKTDIQQKAAQRIMYRLGRNNSLQDNDYEDLVDHVEMFMDFVEKKRNSQKPKVQSDIKTGL